MELTRQETTEAFIKAQARIDKEYVSLDEAQHGEIIPEGQLPYLSFLTRIHQEEYDLALEAKIAQSNATTPEALANPPATEPAATEPEAPTGEV